MAVSRFVKPRCAGLGALVVGLAVCGCGGGNDEPTATRDAPAPSATIAVRSASSLSIHSGGSLPPLPYLTGRVLHETAGDPGTRIAFDDPAGCFGAAAVRLPDRRLLVTRVVARRGADSGALREHVRLDIADPIGRRTTVFADPACSPAVSRSGRVAYIAGERAFTPGNTRIRGRVMVRQTPASRPQPWTDAGAWCDPTWAGSRLLVTTCGEQAADRELLVLDGPGRRRSISRPPRGNEDLTARVIAVSPDGGLAAIVREQEAVPAGLDPVVSIVRLADARVLAALDIKDAVGAGLGGDGNWVGDRIVATTAYCCGGATSPAPVLVVLRYAAGHLRLDRVAAIDYEDIGEQTQNGPTADQPRFVTAGMVGVWLRGVRTRWLTCRLRSGDCAAARAASTPPEPGLGRAARLVTRAQETG